MNIDAHLHVWDLSRARYDWLTSEAGVLFRDHTLDETEAARRDLGVDGVVLVQSSDNDEDTRTMLDAAAAHPGVRGIVGWAPWDDAHGVERRIAQWRADGAPIVGTRNLIHDRADPTWVLRDDVNDGLGVLAEAGLPIDFVTSNPEALSHIETIAARQPDLRIVVDHLGKPPIGDHAAGLDRWTELVDRVAAIPTVSMKVSGLYPTTRPMTAWSVSDLRPVVQTAVDLFGAERLMMGGDWPIAVLAGGYRRVWGALAELVAELPLADRTAIGGATAASFYRLDAAS